MTELPELIYFNPLSITASNTLREGSYQVYVRTHKYPDDAVYRLVKPSEMTADEIEAGEHAYLMSDNDKGDTDNG